MLIKYLIISRGVLYFFETPTDENDRHKNTNIIFTIVAHYYMYAVNTQKSLAHRHH